MASKSADPIERWTAKRRVTLLVSVLKAETSVVPRRQAKLVRHDDRANLQTPGYGSMSKHRWPGLLTGTDCWTPQTCVC